MAPLKSAIDEMFGVLSKFAASMGAEGKKMQAEITAASKKVNAELSTISQEYKTNAAAAGDATKKSAEGFVNLRTQLRNAKTELQQASETYGAFSKEALAAAEKVGTLRDKQDELREIADAFDPRTKMKAVADLAGAAAGGISILAGGMAALGMSTEDSQKTMERLMGLMAAMQGITAIEGLIGTFNTLKASVMANIAAQGALKTAMIATGIGAAVVAVGALVANWDSVVGAIKDFLGVAPGAEEAQKKIAEAAERESKAMEKNIKFRQQYFSTVYMLQELAIKAAKSGTEEEVELRKLAYKKDLEALYQLVLEKKITMAQYHAAGLNMQKIMNDDIADLHKKDKDEYVAMQAEKVKKAEEARLKLQKIQEEEHKKYIQLRKADFAALEGIEKNKSTAIVAGLKTQIKAQTKVNDLTVAQGHFSMQSAQAAISARAKELTTLDIAKQKYTSFIDTLKGTQETATAMNKAFASETQKLMADIASQMGDAIGEALVTGDFSMTNLFKDILFAVAGFMQQLGKQFIAIGTAQAAIELGLATMNPAIAVGAGIALVAAGAAAKKLMSEGITPMAKGGLLFGPQMILAGEYSGAASNPEVIAPLDKLKNIIGGNGGRVQVQGVMGGRDIYFTNQQYSRINRRITGR